MSSRMPLNDTLGILGISITLSNITYGINSMQTFLYYTNHSKRDRWFLKAFVGSLWIMETLICILLNYGDYYYTVTHFGNYDVLTNSPTVWSILVEIGLSTVIALQAQCFFAHRVYILGGKKIALPIIIVVLSLAQFAFGIVYIDVSMSFKRFAGGSSDFPYVISLYGLELIADTTTAVSSIYYLRVKANRSEVTSTKQVIYVIIKYVVNTCLLEVVCIIPIIALWTADASSLVYDPFLFGLSRVYSASVLCSLNNRDYLRELSTRGQGMITMSNLRVRSGDDIAQGQDGPGGEDDGRDRFAKNAIRLDARSIDTGVERSTKSEDKLV